MIWYVVYISHAVTEFLPSELVALLRSARAYNQAHGISGVLAYAGGNFMQLLEGEERAVRDLLMRIERDPRHSGVKRMISGESDTRMFGEWSMAFREHADLTETDRGGFKDLFGSDPSLPEIKHRALTLLKTFRANMR